MPSRVSVVFSSEPEERKQLKTETVAEFLARGGVINRISAPDPEQKSTGVKPTSGGGPAVIMSMDEADLYYGEHKGKKAAAKKSSSTIDLSALPPELRKKYVDDVINGEVEEDDDGE